MHAWLEQCWRMKLRIAAASLSASSPGGSTDKNVSTSISAMLLISWMKLTTSSAFVSLFNFGTPVKSLAKTMY